MAANEVTAVHGALGGDSQRWGKTKGRRRAWAALFY